LKHGQAWLKGKMMKIVRTHDGKDLNTKEVSIVDDEGYSIYDVELSGNGIKISSGVYGGEELDYQLYVLPISYGSIKITRKKIEEEK